MNDVSIIWGSDNVQSDSWELPLGNPSRMEAIKTGHIRFRYASDVAS